MNSMKKLEIHIKKIAKIFLSLVTLFLFISCCYADKNVNNQEKIQSLLDNFRKESNAPAAVLTINYADNRVSNYVSGNIKKTTNNLFQIGSITKSFTAVIILQLEAEGKLSINDTI